MSVTLSNLTMSRVSAGSSGSVPAATDPYWSSVSLLTETTGVNGANNRVFLDSSVNNFTITNSGSPTQGTFSPFANGGGSGYLNGSSYISAPDNAALELGSSNFTIETWIYLTGTNPSNGACIISKSNTSSFGPFSIAFNPSGTLSFAGSSTGTTWDFNIASTVAYATLVNSWNHVALVRNGSAFNLYLNGVSIASTTFAGTLVNNTQSLMIGYINYPGTFCTGYISNTRVVNGTAIYTGTFTPSTTPLTAITNTSLLLNYTNAGIYDAAAENNMFTMGTAQVSTTQSKWSPTSLYLNGSSYVTMNTNTNLQFVAGDFTIEGWVYPTVSGLQQMINQDDAISNNQTFTVRKEANNALGFIYYPSSVRGSGVSVTTSNTLTLNAWSYIAISRTGSTLKMYINGVQGYSGSAATMYQGTNPTTLGAFTNGLYGYNFTGYMQDLRITKGVGRYPTTCAVPTAAFPTN